MTTLRTRVLCTVPLALTLGLPGLATPQDDAAGLGDFGYGGGDEIDHPELVPDQPVRVLVSPLVDEAPTWVVNVPAGVTAMRLWTTGATDDVSLHVTSEYYMEPGFADLTGPDAWLDEDLLLTVTDGFPLYEAPWYVTVTAGVASREPDTLTATRAQLHVAFPEPARATLVPDEVVEVEVTMDQALRAILTLPEDFDPPRRSTWQVELYGPELDADLLVGPADPRQTLAFPYGTSSRTIGYERVTFRGRQAKALVVHAFGLPEVDRLERTTFRLRLSEVTDDRELPSLLPPVAQPSFGDDARSRALAGTVAIFGSLGSGSGTLLSANGLVVTNAHVVLATSDELAAGSEASAEPPIYFAGFPTDPREAVRPQVALELLDYDQEQDLALLAVRGALDGRPLPADLRLPALERGSTRDLSLGDPLWSLGYPMTGGEFNLTTITLTRGILAGFSSPAEGGQLKTDAAIHAGVSGGALLDEAWRLVGIPSSSITDANLSGGLGFAVPVEALPPTWLELAEREDLGELLARMDGSGGEGAPPLGPHLPLDATLDPASTPGTGVDRLAWVLLAEDVARWLDGGPDAALEERILAHDQAAFPALLNALALVDTGSADQLERGGRLVDLLGRVSHEGGLAWHRSTGPDGTPTELTDASNRGQVARLVADWTKATADPRHWIEMAHLDRPEHRAERERFDALLTRR